MIKKQVNKKFWRTFASVFLEALVVVVVILTFLWMSELAYYSFSNTPYQKHAEESLEVWINPDTSIDEVSERLEQDEVIPSRFALRMRYYCSDYRQYALCPGKYHVTAGMGIDDLLDDFTGR